ncbi:MAG: sulfur oxidation c-type cytochrome SoxX [Burkholderiales bacterium]|nr:sulfur oxidation c-type cytochrome SoxX [Burkholderiales bacterium]
MVSRSVACRVVGTRIILGCLSIVVLAFPALAAAQTAIVDGRALFMDERKGNCSACHKTPADTLLKSASNVGPPLESIKQKYAAPVDRLRLREAISDLSKRNPDTIMPPYGKHRILTETEINAIVAYLETL